MYISGLFTNTLLISFEDVDFNPRSGRKNQDHMSAHLHFKEIASDLAAPFSCYRVFHLGNQSITTKALEVK